MALTDKQEAFCIEYLVDLNATQAAIRAGYAEKTARTIGSENIAKPDIASRIQELMNVRAERVQRTADDVLRDIGRVREDAMVLATDNQGNRFMNNHSGALKALELEGKHLKMFTDKHELTGPNGGPIEVTRIERVIIKSP